MSENEAIDNLRVTKLRTYLMNIISELDENYQKLNVNFLSDDPNNYSLDKIPVAVPIETWIIGQDLHHEVYSLRSRMEYNSDAITNIQNMGFFELFEDKIRQNNREGELPDIDGIESIACLNCGTLNNANTNTGEFDIQIEIQYREKV